LIFFLKIIYVTCHVNIVSMLSHYGDTCQVIVLIFGPYICYFDYILVPFFKKNSISSLQIETKFNFYINIIMIFLL